MRELTRLERLIAGVASRDPIRVNDPSRPEAAVALLLVADPDRLLLIRRADRVGDPWSGQLALPGGRRDGQDEDLLATAIRETREETGLELERAWHVATLDDLAPRSAVLPPILVRPFVFHLEAEMVPQVSDEVAQVGWVTLDYLTGPGVFRTASINIRGADREVEGYHLPEGFLWGMTERIVTPVLQRWQLLGTDSPIREGQ
ncbi:MAG: CoA pyrophosphatase [Gemmatimonadota bacterium]